MLNFQFKKLFGITVTLCLLSASCHQDGNKSAKPATNKTIVKHFQLPVPEKNQQYKQTDNIKIEWKGKDDLIVDSVKIQLDELVVLHANPDSNNLILPIKKHKTGHRSLRVTFYADSVVENHIVPVLIFADAPPVKLGYKVLNKFPHDDKAYTQGLLLYDNYLYESTGQRRGESSLRKVKPATGEVVKKYQLKDQFFGEGIAKVGNQIFMLTYTSHLGFIFDINSFEQIREFPLQTMQGWGLTTIDNKLLLSDGTSKLYFYHPEDFSLINTLDVCNDNSFIQQLNELEYTNQGVFANIYTTHQIVRIDSETGAVTGTLDLSQLYPKDVTFDYDHVLNGIAWDEQSNTFYVTGKYWPILYQLQITE